MTARNDTVLDAVRKFFRLLRLIAPLPSPRARA